MLLGRMLWIDTTASYGNKTKTNLSFKQLLHNSTKIALRRPTLSLNDANSLKENKKREKLEINSWCDYDLWFPCTCECINPDEVLRDQFVLQIREKKFQEKLLDQAQICDKALTFDKAISLAKNYEATKTNISSNNDAEKCIKKPESQGSLIKRSPHSKCLRCGMSHEKFKCLAFGK